MARRLLITDHALHRFAERHPEVEELAPNERRQVFLAELEHGVPFGWQLGDDELRLLPSGVVAVISSRDGVGIVKTVLTKNLAIANMQSQGFVPTRLRRLDRPDPRAPKDESDTDAPAESAADPVMEATMRRLAEKHLSEGIGKKGRNALLRELGYDPSGPAGDVYRAALHAMREAKRAADHEQALRNRRPRGPGITPTQLTDFATRYTAAWCSHEPQRVAEFFAEEGSLTLNRGAPAIGRAAIATAAEGFMTAFPDLVVHMDRLGVTGPTVYYHWTLTGTNTGPSGTGRPVHISGVEEWTFDPDGRIAQSLGYFDEAAYRGHPLEASPSGTRKS
jgi:uncharacterized protein (TIGR02246 family)